MSDSRLPMTHGELLDLETVTVDLETSNRAFGLGRSLGYKLARTGRYPCLVIKAGNTYRVVTADLRCKLGVPETVESA